MVWRWPAGQLVLHGEHTVLDMRVAKVLAKLRPATHSVTTPPHTRSEVAVGAAVWKLAPWEQTVVTEQDGTA